MKKASYDNIWRENIKLFYQQHFCMQPKAEIDKKPSKC